MRVALHGLLVESSRGASTRLFGRAAMTASDGRRTLNPKPDLPLSPETLGALLAGFGPLLNVQVLLGSDPKHLYRALFMTFEMQGYFGLALHGSNLRSPKALASQPLS